MGVMISRFEIVVQQTMLRSFLKSLVNLTRRRVSQTIKLISTEYAECDCYESSILNSPTVASPSCLVVFLPIIVGGETNVGEFDATHVAIGMLLIKLHCVTIISH